MGSPTSDDRFKSSRVLRRKSTFFSTVSRRIQNRREKIFLAPPWASTGHIVKNINMTSPVLAQGVVRNFFSRRIRILRPKIILK
jgi:hypothetical protein